MKTVTIIGLLLVGVGLYMEYSKDFSTFSTGSLLAGAGGGLLIGTMM